MGRCPLKLVWIGSPPPPSPASVGRRKRSKPVSNGPRRRLSPARNGHSKLPATAATGGRARGCATSSSPSSPGVRRRGGRGDCLLRLVRRRGDCGLRIIPGNRHRCVRDMGGPCLRFLRRLEHHLDHLLYCQCQWWNRVPAYRRIHHDSGTLQRLRAVGRCAPLVEADAGWLRQLRQRVLVAPCRLEPRPPLLRIRRARRWTRNRLRRRILRRLR